MPRLPFTAPWLLAPMEGVTDPCYRAVLLARHQAEDLGGACTEFLRVVDHAYRPDQVRKHLGQDESPIPVGVQLMGSHESALAGTAESVLETGAAFLDLNFGCPTKGALKGCAGSALLREPKRLESIVRACVQVCGTDLPVTAKIRAGFDDAESVLLRGLKIHRELNLNLKIVANEIALARVYAGKENYQKARTHFSEARTIAEADENRSDLGKVAHQEALLLVREGTEDPRDKFEEAISLFDALGRQRDVERVRSDMDSIYLLQTL